MLSVDWCLGEDADQIESMEWLQDFARRYMDAWNSYDKEAVAALTTEDILWDDPGLESPARGHAELIAFLNTTSTAFPDYEFTHRGAMAISDDRRVAYVPVRMSGTHTGPLDPPGFAPTGRRISLDVIDAWTFRDGLIWRYRAAYDSIGLGRQLGLAPRRGGFSERGWARIQRLGIRFPA